MALAYINISTKQYFNFMCRTDFERRIFHDTYKEFQKKSGPYNLNKSLHTFSQMCEANEKAHDLNQKLQYSVMNAIGCLENEMPVLKDVDGISIAFDFAELQICTSDLLNKAGHVVSLTYTSPRLVLHEIIDDLLILSYDDESNSDRTFMIKLADELVINYERNKEFVYN